MRVPHVTNDDGCLIWLPLLGLLAHSVGAIGRLLPETLVDRHEDWTGRFRTNPIEHDRERGKKAAAQRIALTRRNDWKRGEMELMSMASLVVGFGRQTTGSAGYRRPDYQFLNKIPKATLVSQAP